MSTLQQVMFVIACAATAVLILQIILMLVGGSSDADIPGGISDADVSDLDLGGGGGISDLADVDLDLDVPGGGVLDSADSDFSGGGGASDATDDATAQGGVNMPFGLRLLSLRSIIAFVAVGGWMCYTLCYVLDWYFALIISLACGFGAACAMAAAIMGMEKLQGNGNLDPNNAIGKIGTVYLTVPPKRTGTGKINVLIQERYAEYEAVTNGDEELKTASQIKVVGHAGNNVLIVEKYRKPSISIEEG